MSSDLNAPAPESDSLNLLRRGGEIAAWLSTGILLAVMPKCPLCLAAYVAIATGIGLSFSTAWYLQWGLISLCGCSFLFLATRLMRRSLRILSLGNRQLDQSSACGCCPSVGGRKDR